METKLDLIGVGVTVSHCTERSWSVFCGLFVGSSHIFSFSLIDGIGLTDCVSTSIYPPLARFGIYVME